jgi:hypothetical protein
MNPERVALSIKHSQKGHSKMMLVLGRAILERLGVQLKGLITIEVDRLVGQLRVSKGAGWRVYKWGETGSGNVQLTAALCGIPAAQHPIEDLKHAWDPEGRLLIVLPTWAKPVVKANGKAA